LSLTSLLSKRDNSVREFFENKLPITKPFQDAWRKTFAVNIYPEHPVAWSLVGAAIDYRIRYFLINTPVESLVAARGATRISQMAPAWYNFSQGLTSFLAQVKPVGQTIDDATEQIFAKYCYCLAMYESLFRAQNPTSPLLNLPCGASVEEHLNLVPDEAVKDLLSLTKAAITSFTPHRDKNIIPNPSFKGSNDVGGADADIIIDNWLIDFKTVKEPSLKRDMLYQLVGYAILDYDDRYKISHAGFYLSRAPAFLQFEINQMIDTMSQGKETLFGLRFQFQQLF
jgi:hypothetical protein